MTKMFGSSHGYRMKIQYRQFIWLWFLKLMGYKTFRIDHSVICTTGGILTIGAEYQYREGGYLERVIIEDIDFKGWFIILKLWFIDRNRHDHKMVNCNYAGIWRIWDKDHYTLEGWQLLLREA